MSAGFWWNLIGEKWCLVFNLHFLNWIFNWSLKTICVSFSLKYLFISLQLGHCFLSVLYSHILCMICIYPLFVIKIAVFIYCFVLLLCVCFCPCRSYFYLVKFISLFLNCTCMLNHRIVFSSLPGVREIHPHFLLVLKWF